MLYLNNDCYEYKKDLYLLKLKKSNNKIKPILYVDNIKKNTKFQITSNNFYNQIEHTKWSLKLQQLCLDLYRHPKINIENYPDLFRYVSRLGVYFPRFAFYIDFKYLTPEHKFIKLYFQKTDTFTYIYKHINNKECYDYLKNNIWAQRAFCCWALRVGKFYSFLHGRKYKNIIKNLDYTWINERMYLDSWITVNKSRKYRTKRLVCSTNKYGNKTSIKNLINFYKGNDCEFPTIDWSVDIVALNKNILPINPNIFDISRWLNIYENTPEKFNLAKKKHKKILKNLNKYIHNDYKLLEVEYTHVKCTIEYLYEYFYKYYNNNIPSKLLILKLKYC